MARAKNNESKVAKVNKPFGVKFGNTDGLVITKMYATSRQRQVALTKVRRLPGLVCVQTFEN